MGLKIQERDFLRRWVALILRCNAHVLTSTTEEEAGRQRESLPGKWKQQALFTGSIMAAVHSLRVSVKSDSGSDRLDSDSDSESQGDAREAEPMEVEEGELEVEAEDISVNRSLKKLVPVSAPD